MVVQDYHYKTQSVTALSEAPTQIRFVVGDPHGSRLYGSPILRGILKQK